MISHVPMLQEGNVNSYYKEDDNKPVCLDEYVYNFSPDDGFVFT